jgi:hypothetical protein
VPPSIHIEFRNGSIGTIHYFANGSKAVDKEYVEVYQSGLTGILNDFRRLEIFGKGRIVKRKLWVQDKGQENMVHAFLDNLKSGKGSLIPFEELYSVSLATFAAHKCLLNPQITQITQI